MNLNLHLEPLPIERDGGIENERGGVVEEIVAVQTGEQAVRLAER